MTLSSTTTAVGGLGLDTIVNIPLALDLNNNLRERSAAGMLLQSSHHLQELVELNRSRVIQINLHRNEKKKKTIALELRTIT